MQPTKPDRLLDSAGGKASYANDVEIQLLRQQWDEKLACLNEPGAAQRLASTMHDPLDLDGNVIAGDSF